MQKMPNSSKAQVAPQLSPPTPRDITESLWESKQHHLQLQAQEKVPAKWSPTPHFLHTVKLYETEYHHMEQRIL